MNKYIAILSIVLAACFGSCQDDMGVSNGTIQRNPDEGLPIAFTTEVLLVQTVGDASSRADVEDLYKKEFVEGDYLHVSATFTLLNENEESAETPATTTQYELLRFSNGEWISTDSDLLRWPWNAEKADFTAYFIGASDGLLQEDDPKEIALDTLSYNTDPLLAEAKEVAYGHAVRLEFHHLCTKLTLTDVSSSGSEFWAKKEGICNQFHLTRNENDELIHTFVTVGDNPHVAAQRTADNTVSYYLAPGDYQGMSLTYRYDRPYLTLNIDKLGTETTEGYELLAGTSYVVSITQNAGSITIDEDEDDWWEEPGDKTTTVKLPTEEDINAFLTAIANGTEYAYNETPVLGRSPDIQGGTELLVNVDFNDQDFDDHNLPNAVFNGNYHYIENVKRPLFNQINGGRILNLSLYHVNIKENYVTAVGAIARESTTANATAIHNVRLHDINIYVTPTQNYDEACDVGALVGNSNSVMDSIRLGGNISVTVATTDTERRLGTINVGGIVGQLYAAGQLNHVSRLEETTPGSITVTSSCPNRYGDRNTGGLVGLSNGHIEDCLLNNATVDASKTRGIMVYTGGLAGMARGTVGTHSSTTNTNGIFRSTFSGTIKCGRAYSASTTEESAEGHAYAGGAVGYAYWSDNIEGNEIFGTLVGPIGDDGQNFRPWTNSIYATGGLFGQTYQAPTSDNTTWIVFKDQLNNDVDNYHIGTIAGRADEKSTPDQNTSHTPGDWEKIGATITATDLPGEETGN